MSKNARDLFNELASEVKEEFQRTHNRLSYLQYLQMLEEDPYKLTRTSYQYIRDAILHFGKEEIKDCGETLPRFKIFDDPFFNGEMKLVGQERPVKKLFKHINACAEQEEDESIFVLIGPPGTGKSRVFYLIEKGLEEYSRTDEGAVYTYNWLFREKFEAGAKEQLGFGNIDEMKSEEQTSYSDLPESEIFSRMECPMQDNPISLIPRKKRERLLNKILESKREEIRNNVDDPDERERQIQQIDDFVIPRKIHEMEPCRNCQNIRERLMKLYDGDWHKVMKHVEVVRFLFSLERGKGIAEVDPGVNVETNLQPISPDSSKRDVSSILKGLTLFEFYGKPSCATRGLINYQDIFNKNHKQLQHLLSAIEEKTVDFGDVTHKVDFAIFGSTNIPEVELLEENVMTEGLRDRIEKISVPYLLNYKREREIYRPNVHEIRKDRHISPHTVEMGALYTVLTRMNPPDMSGWFEEREKKLAQEEKAGNTDSGRLERRQEILEKQKELIEEMDQEQKARIYTNDFSTIPPDYRPALTDKFVSALRNEHRDEEGKDGRSPRWFKRILGNLARSASPGSGCINPFQLYEAILENEGEDMRERLDLVQKNYNNRVLREVEEALFNVEEQDILDRVNRYLDHAKAYLREEKVYDEVQEKRVEPDEYLDQEEDFIGIDEDPAERESFRESIIHKFGSYVNEEVSRPDPRIALPGLLQRFKRAMYSEMKSDFQIEPFLLALNSFYPDREDLFSSLDPDEISGEEEQLKSVYRAINRMREFSRKRMEEQNRDPRAGYCNDCARKVIKYVLTTEKTREKFLEVAPGSDEEDPPAFSTGDEEEEETDDETDNEDDGN